MAVSELDPVDHDREAGGPGVLWRQPAEGQQRLCRKRQDQTRIPRRKAAQRAIRHRLHHRRPCERRASGLTPLARRGHAGVRAKRRGGQFPQRGYEGRALEGSPRRGPRYSKWRRMSAQVSIQIYHQIGSAAPTYPLESSPAALWLGADTAFNAELAARRASSESKYKDAWRQGMGDQRRRVTGPVKFDHTPLRGNYSDLWCRALSFERPS